MHFLLRTFHLIPPLLWWAVAGVVVGALNLLFQLELWPHTPGVEPVALMLIVGCLPLGQWGVVITLERIRQTVRHTFWWMCWSLAWLLSILIFAGMVAVCLFSFAIILS
ncbi:hypothetical protein F1C16_13275 [Hymenobacter sp. NBH84]|uniref:hypothetical protein n=1 Tax=Hymenobacter sp. NBH84 TaxID=2596915 RepID=UPI001627A193|nr:hypothetical protein [Hymenobacter sp. NBH84]QNE40459.1 hypothetical protein F1C16_13275 [Hymenobacter sp. NBH84]